MTLVEQIAAIIDPSAYKKTGQKAWNPAAEAHAIEMQREVAEMKAEEIIEAVRNFAPF